MDAYSAEGTITPAWWSKDVPSDQRHHPLMTNFKFIQERDVGRREEDLLNLRMYANRNILGIGPTTHHVVDPWQNMRMSLNVTKSVCDTATAKVAKNKPKPVFLTSGGNYSAQKKARNLEKFVDTVFYKNKLYESGPRSFLDATILGTGFMHVFVDASENIKIERVFPGEIVVDQAEGIYGEPRTMYRQTFINREVLMAMFPKKADEIRKADRVPYDHYRSYPTHDTTADQLLVVSAYHLPSTDSSGDGRYTVAIDEVTLVDEEWKYEWFPFVPYRWTDRQLGYFGMGIAEEVRGIQQEINRIAKVIQESMRRLGVPWVLVETGSAVQKAHINNEIGAIVPYKGAPPIVKPNQSVHPEMFDHLRFLISQVYELSGVSQSLSTGQKPAGLTSGIGMREASERETTRFAIVAQAYEQMYLELAKRVVAYGKELNKKVVLQRDKYTIEQVDWSEVDLKADEYVLKVYPSSALPDDPAGRLNMVEEMLGVGLLNPRQAARLLDFPDLEAENRLDRASHEYITMVMEKILDEGIYTSPEPFMDLDLAKMICQAEYNKALQFDDIPEDRLQMLRDFMTQIHEMKKKAELELQRAQMPTVAPEQALTAAPPPVNPDGSQPGAVGSADVMSV